MTWQNDPNRAKRTSRTGLGWGAAALAALLVIGGIVMFGNSDRSTTAAVNDRSPITNNVPAQTPAPIPNNSTPSR
jgi:hypothetical protein